MGWIALRTLVAIHSSQLDGKHELATPMFFPVKSLKISTSAQG